MGTFLSAMHKEMAERPSREISNLFILYKKRMISKYNEHKKEDLCETP